MSIAITNFKIIVFVFTDPYLTFIYFGPHFQLKDYLFEIQYLHSVPKDANILFPNFCFAPTASDIISFLIEVTIITNLYILYTY